MSTYKILGSYSYAANIKKVKLNDMVILKQEYYNIKSKDAIGVYTIDNMKLGYISSELWNKLSQYSNSYKISNITLNKNFCLEISRAYSKISYLVLCLFNAFRRI